MTTTIHHGDCLEVMRSLPDNSVHAVITDPPYGLSNTTPEQVADTIVRWVNGERDYLPSGKGFMNRAWDAFVPPVAVWDEAMRVLKPGGHVLAFAGTRTVDLMTLGLRLAGFDIRDSLAWLYGSGFPKSMDVSKAIDKEAYKRDLFEPIRTHIREWRDYRGMSNADLNEAVGSATNGCGMARHWTSTEGGQHAIPSKDQWRNLKRVLDWPDCELDAIYDAVVDGAERPITGTHKSGVLTGVSGLTAGGQGKARRDIPATDEARKWEGWGSALKPATEPIVMARKPFKGTLANNVLEHGTGAINIDATRIATDEALGRHNNVPSTFNHKNTTPYVDNSRGLGRWPANVILDEHMARVLDQQSGVLKSGALKPYVNANRDSYSGSMPEVREVTREADSGGASRFFYVAKAPKRERPVVDGVSHPTTKPLTLMRYLVRMVTPPGGTILEPFAGSGTTIEAAMLEGFDCIGIEREAEYLPLIHERIRRATEQLETEDPEQGSFSFEETV